MTQNCWQCPYSWLLRRCKSLNNRSHLVQKWSCECLLVSIRRRLCTTWESVEAHRSLCTPSSLHPPPTVWRANFQETSASCNVWEWLIWESRKWRFGRDRWKPRTSTRPEWTQWNTVTYRSILSGCCNFLAVIFVNGYSLDRRIRAFSRRGAKCRGSPWQPGISRSPPLACRLCTKLGSAREKYWLRSFRNTNFTLYPRDS